MLISSKIDERGRYRYLVECPYCEKQRWVAHKRASTCKVCAGKQSYVAPSVPRRDKRMPGDGYITSQGYHLVYRDGRYIPAHRIVAGEIPENHVVHHIDGNKINNKPENLIVLSKKDHRETHGQLERLSYYLIQTGMIEFSDGRYSLSSAMKKFVDENAVNSGEALSVDAEGNPEPIPHVGRCNDYPFEE